MKSNILHIARDAFKKATNRPSEGEKMMVRFTAICPHAAAYAQAILPSIERLHLRRRVANFDMAIKHAPQDLPRLVAIKLAIEHFQLPRDVAGFTAKQRHILRHLKHAHFNPQMLLAPALHAA